MENFHFIEYIVFFLILAISAGIGIYYGFCGNKQRSNEDYILGGRKNGAFPVACSLIVSFISAIAVLGYSSEVFYYGAQPILGFLIFIPFTLVMYYLYIPVYFNLQLTSAYEYFELRFNRGLRITISIVSILYLLAYMSLVVYGPALCLNHLLGIDRKILCAITFAVAIFYTTVGGFKAVIWTDTLQFLVMVVSLSILVGKGISDVGGIDVVLHRLEEGQCLEFFNFDIDPRTRHTVFTSLISIFVMWLQLYMGTQANVQRFVSLPDMKAVKRCLIINLIGIYILCTVMYGAGLIAYAKFHNCDPLTQNKITSSDQLMVYFAMGISTPGVLAMFVSGLVCASLSTISSGLNALSAIITEDYIKKQKPNLKDETMSFLSKVICVISGCISFAFVFIVDAMQQNILPAFNTLTGILMAPTLGLFTLGMFFPQANSKGTILGLLTTYIIMTCFGVGHLYTASNGLLPNQKLTLATTECDTEGNLNITTFINQPTQIYWKDIETDMLTKILSISFNWHSVLGLTFTICFGLLFSTLITRFDKRYMPDKVSRKCLSPPLISMWQTLFPNVIKTFVDDEESTTHEKENGHYIVNGL